jgi:hypothetical protein
MDKLNQLKAKKEKIEKQISDLEAKERLELEKNKDKIIYTKIPELNIEISQQVYNNKTYPEILELVDESKIVTHDMLFKLRSLTDKYPQFKEFYVFVPNPDLISKNRGYVSRFNAGSDWANLNCYRGPTYRDGVLGVILCRDLKVNKSKLKVK